jgi:hypothetical protein
MAKVWWSEQAEANLELINPDVRDQLVLHAEDILHDIPPGTANPADEGTHEGIMWRRGSAGEKEPHESLWEEDDKGVQAWDYFLFYRPLGVEEFEVLAVVGIHRIAKLWIQMSRESSAA